MWLKIATIAHNNKRLPQFCTVLDEKFKKKDESFSIVSYRKKITLFITGEQPAIDFMLTTSDQCLCTLTILQFFPTCFAG